MLVESDPAPSFAELALPEPLLRALTSVGYEQPSAIQARIIPALLEGRDVIGQAPTGTGKTAAFALPILARLEAPKRPPQALVLCPTRELAIQVAEAFQEYAAFLPRFQVLPVYGGRPLDAQQRLLRRGVSVVVGTPGRVMDHMRRGSLVLDSVRTLVLDEADEMLRMGFLDDVRWILERTPAARQIALFSATMPDAIRAIAQQHLREPVEVKIQVEKLSAAGIRQRYLLLKDTHKLEALTRILDAGDCKGALVFVRTRHATTRLATKLAARGYSSAALSGSVTQRQRELTLQQLRDGQLDTVVATDVAARGLDVDRISHVINYDIPADPEVYVHRIGRTGRFGAEGDAILFVVPRERSMLHRIEKIIGQSIERMAMPSEPHGAPARRAPTGQAPFREALATTSAKPAPRSAPQAARPARSDAPATPPAEKRHPAREPAPREREAREREPREREPRVREPRVREPRGERADAEPLEVERFRFEVGREHGVVTSDLVDAIIQGTGLPEEYIGRIEIDAQFSVVDLPKGMPKELFKSLQKTWVRQRPLKASRIWMPAHRPRPASRRDEGARSVEPRDFRVPAGARPARHSHHDPRKKPGSGKPSGKYGARDGAPSRRKFGPGDGAPTKGKFGSRDSAPSRGKFGSRDGAPSKGKYRSRDDAPSKGKYGSRDGASSKSRYTPRGDSPSKSSYGASRGDSASKGKYGARGGPPSKGKYGSRGGSSSKGKHGPPAKGPGQGRGPRKAGGGGKPSGFRAPKKR